jgi:glutamate-1-semialdehyde-2,1-aminomutase
VCLLDCAFQQTHRFRVKIRRRRRIETSMIEKSQELYEKAKKVMPGGSQMFNKRPEIYEPSQYPIFAEKVDGPYLYDVDGNRYIDYLLAYGAIHLGYNYPSVQEAVIQQIQRGTIHSINDPLEIELAEELIDTIPSAEMVRYFLSGSEATSAAVRIARAYTGKDTIVKWGYHGWHDWTSLVRGGPTKGMLGCLKMINCPASSISHVPTNVSQSTVELRYNDLDSFADFMKKEGKDVACVIMEPFYYELPENGFLDGVKAIAHEHDSILIFDEVKTGVRVNDGGAQKHFGVTPDMSVFSKAISNGYPFSVVVGKKPVMNVCEKLWFAGTNCGNSVGISASLATIRESKRVGAVEHIWKLGERIVRGLKDLLEIYKIEAEIGGLPPMPNFIFKNNDIDKKKKITNTYLSEMIKDGIFMPIEHCFYISYSHSQRDIDDTLNAMERAFKKIKNM